MRWRVNCQGLKDDDATHPGFEILTADLRRIEDGALCFYRIAPGSQVKTIDVRGFNALKWDDYVIVEEE